MTQLLAINGSYREGGVTDQSLAVLADAVKALGAQLDIVRLRDTPIEFCQNCRQCTQLPGASPGLCIQHDAMQSLVEQVESADGLIFASPTNMGTVTALFKRFSERLIVYAYWPWSKAAPSRRKQGKPRKPALLLSSAAAPSLLARFAFRTQRQLRETAGLVGAKSIGGLITGLVAADTESGLSARKQAQLQKLASKLVYAAKAHQRRA